jgi:hypothetical protein
MELMDCYLGISIGLGELNNWPNEKSFVEDYVFELPWVR